MGHRLGPLGPSGPSWQLQMLGDVGMLAGKSQSPRVPDGPGSWHPGKDLALLTNIQKYVHPFSKHTAEGQTQNVRLLVLVVVNIQRQPVASCVTFDTNCFNAIPRRCESKLVQRCSVFNIFLNPCPSYARKSPALPQCRAPQKCHTSAHVHMTTNSVCQPITIHKPMDLLFENSVIPHGCGCIWASLEAFLLT